MGFLEISYGLLWALIILQALLLRRALQQTVWVKRMYQEFGRRRSPKLRKNTPGPEFVLPIMDSDQVLSSVDLKGRNAALVFLAATDVRSPMYQQLDASLHGIWHKAEGRTFVVCHGTADQCRTMMPPLPTRESGHQIEIPVLLDESGEVSRAYLVTRTPASVLLDEDFRVERYGHQLTAAEVALDQAQSARQAGGGDGHDHQHDDHQHDGHSHDEHGHDEHGHDGHSHGYGHDGHHHHHHHDEADRQPAAAAPARH